MADTSHGNFQSCCRLCLNEKVENLRPVFGDDGALPERIAEFVSVEIQTSDKLSTKICDQCIMKVNHWHAYKQRCVRNQSKLVQWMNNENVQSNGYPELLDMNVQIKQEPKDVAENGPHIEHVHVEQVHVEQVHVEQVHVEQVEAITIKPEPVELLDESMEEEYNELPPDLTPEISMGTEDDMNGDDENSRRCSICYKLFSNVGNRKKHEKSIHRMHGASRKSILNVDIEPPFNGSFYDDMAQEESSINFDPDRSQSTSIEQDLEQEKIQYAAGLKLIQTNSTPISMEPLSKIELSYIEKCKAMVTMHQTLECACHNVTHHNLKGLLSHLRALRIWFPVFTCYSCMITFTDRSTFTKHNVRCPNPQLGTLMKLSNLKKRSEVKTRLYQNFRCTLCKFMYTFHEDFIKHVDEDHASVMLPVACTCSREFDTLEDYKDHVYVSCMVDFYCDICFITTKTLEGFQKHAAEVHDNSDGFILLQDDNYKARRALANTSSCNSKEFVDESAIITGKRERRASHRIPYEEYDDSAPNNKVVINPVVGAKTQNRVCPECSKEYCSYNNMMRHYRTRHVKQKGKMKVADLGESSYYSCPDCNEMYPAEIWQNHLVENHQPKSCDKCDKVFQFQTELDHHRSVHLNLKVYRDSKTQSYKSTVISPGADKLTMCNICDLAFQSQIECDEHKLIHEDNTAVEDKRFSCLTCKKTYASYAGLWEHNRSKHPEKKTPYQNSWPRKCDRCDKVCHTGAALYRHKQIHEKDPIPNDANKRPSLKIKKNSEEDESYHTCNKCFKVFSSRCNLKNHMKSHGMSQATTKRQKQKAAVNVKEENVSEDDLPDLTKDSDTKVPLIFTCDVCVMTFTSKNALKVHQEEHELEEKPSTRRLNRIYCKHCKIPFASTMLLAKHMDVEHSETVKTKLGKSGGKNQQFSCHICKKSFHSSAALTTHVGWHKRGLDINHSSNASSGKPPKLLKQSKTEKPATIVRARPPAALLQVSPNLHPFQCTTCLAQLPNETALQVHVLENHRSVSAIMLLPRCNICSKDFSTQDEYENHKRLHDFLERQKQHENKMMIEHHESKKYQKNFPCNYCTAGFSRSDTLAAHIKQYHKEYIQTEFRCPHCDRLFEKQNSLTIHLKVHEKQKVLMDDTSRRLYSCSICNMGFNVPKDLRTHTITSHPF